MYIFLLLFLFYIYVLVVYKSFMYKCDYHRKVCRTIEMKILYTLVKGIYRLDVNTRFGDGRGWT